jgi:hypothetical protein
MRGLPRAGQLTHIEPRLAGDVLEKQMPRRLLPVEPLIPKLTVVFK